MVVLKILLQLQKVLKVEYVDPANLVYSYTEDPNFEDIYYVGEVKTIPINELKKEFPNLTDEDLKAIEAQSIHSDGYANNRSINQSTIIMIKIKYKFYILIIKLI